MFFGGFAISILWNRACNIPDGGGKTVIREENGASITQRPQNVDLRIIDIDILAINNEYKTDQLFISERGELYIISFTVLPRVGK